MGCVNDRMLLSSAGPSCNIHHRPVILSSLGNRGDRVSTVVRTDGSVFTVTVPHHGMDEPTERSAPGNPWISDDTGRSELSAAGFLRLAAAAEMAGCLPRAGGRRRRLASNCT